VLCKPFDTTEMIQAVEQAAEAASGLTGHVHGLSIVDTLQMFHHSRRSLTLRVLDVVSGSVSMKGGELIDARYGDRVGEAALGEILALRRGSLQTTSLEDVVPTIDRPFQPLLLDLLRRLDERSMPGFGGTQGGLVQLRPNPSEPAELSDVTTCREVDEACGRLALSSPGVRALGVIDLVGERLLGLHDANRRSPRSDEMMRDGIVALCRAARLVCGARAPELEARCEELQLQTGRWLQLVRVVDGGHLAVVFVAEDSAIQSLLAERLRVVADELTPLCRPVSSVASAPAGEGGSSP
jgi:hypothetical protein